jgi:MFS transporter, PAT family, beta-lactamase induction signal transducer AmpG
MNEMEAMRTPALESDGPGGRSVRTPPPWLFAMLIAPMAVFANGIVQGGMLAYFMTHRGVGIGKVAAIISTVSLPTAIYFLWSPITDFFVERRTWLAIGAITGGLLMGEAFHMPDITSRAAVLMMFLAACASQLVVASCGGMMGTLPDGRPRALAGSFYQAGSAGFGALSAFVLIKVVGHNGWFSHAADVAGGWQRLLILLIVVLIAAPGLVALAVPRTREEQRETFGEAMGRLAREFKATFWRWEAIPYALLLTFPINSGAAIGLLAGIAQSYGVTGDQVAWINGAFGGLLLAAGSLGAMLIPAKARASVAYLTVGLVNAATLLVLWLGPMRPAVYLVGTMLYLFTSGTGLATFTAVVLEFMGESGKSGSGRYSIINSLGNVPVLYMIALDGWGGSRWGARGVSATEAVLSFLGALVLLAYFLTRRPGRQIQVNT